MERWARELSARLPALRPGGYAVLRPPPRSRTAPATRGSSSCCRLRARGARAAAAVPGQPRAARPSRAPCSCSTTPRRCATPAGTRRAYVAWQRRLLPVLARRRAADRDRVGVLARRAGRAARRRPGARRRSSPAASTGASRRTPTPRRRAPRARAASGPYVLCVASHTARKNLAALGPAARALAAEGVELVAAGGHRPQFAAEQGLEELRLLGHVDDALLPGLYAGRARRSCSRRSTRASGCRCSRRWRPGRRCSRPRPPRCPRPARGAARLAEPEPEPLREALLALLADDAERARLRAAGLARAARPHLGAHRARDGRAAAAPSAASGSATRRPAPWRSPAAAVRRRRKAPSAGAESSSPPRMRRSPE